MVDLFTISSISSMFMQSAITAITGIFTRKAVDKIIRPGLPATISRAQQNPELLRQESTLLQRREERADIELKANMQIAARQLELDAQRVEVSRLYLEAMQQQTRQELQQREKELEAEYDKNTWGSLFSRQEIQNIFNQHSQQHRLLMLIPEPKMANKLPQDFRDNLESGLRNKLKRFVEKHYPLHNSLCPVEFYGRFFDRAVFDADLKKLEQVLSVPTAIIYTDINNREVFFNLKLTGLDKPLALTCDEWNWRETWRELQQQGMNEDDSLEQIETLLIQAHQTLAAFLADWYYLNINPHHIPRLFDENLQRELPKGWVQPCLAALLEVRESYLRALADEEARREREEKEKARLAAQQKAEAERKQREAEAQRRQQEAAKGTAFSFETVTVKDTGYIIKRESKTAYEKVFDLGSGVKLSMVYIPAGEFMMGARDGEASARDSEYPRHKVLIKQPFYLGKYPITQAQYQAVMGKNPARFKDENRPVEQVSWEEAHEFCKGLAYRTGEDFRLPTEAEWEYACRAGTDTPFYFGPTITSDIANFNANQTYGNAPKGTYRQKTTPVGQFPPNAFGLYDMHGNVWEWTGSAWAAPYDGNEFIRKNDAKNYVLRGGSWVDDPDDFRAAVRLNGSRGTRCSASGFRVCVAPRT